MGTRRKDRILIGSAIRRMVSWIPIKGFFYEIPGMVGLYRVAATMCFFAAGVSLILTNEVVGYTRSKNGTDVIRLLRKPGMIRLLAAIASSEIGFTSIAFIHAILIINELQGAPFLVGSQTPCPR
ncbi:MAG: hypothetical protein ACW99J_13250 [Candidatus Thorarchaeota archaeon]